MLTKNLIDENQFPNLEFDWTQKIKLGKFNKFKDQYLNIIWANKNVQPKKVKLSKRIKELNLDQQFLVNQNVAESSQEEEIKIDVISDESDFEAIKIINDEKIDEFDEMIQNVEKYEIEIHDNYERL